MQIPQAPPQTPESNPVGDGSGNLNFTFSQVKLLTPNVGTSLYKPVPLSEGARGGRIRGGR